MLRALILAFALIPAALDAQPAKAPPAAPLPTAALRAMLDHLPASAVQGRVQIDFGDPAAMRAQDLSAVAGAETDPAFAQLRAFPRSEMVTYIRDPATAWRQAVGFGPSDVAQLLLAGVGNEAVTILQVMPGTAARVPPVLAARGYTETARHGLTAWARGEDFRLDLRARNPDDPFGGHLGRASRVWIEGDLIRQGAGWPVLQALAGAAGQPASAHADLAALLDAVDGAGAPGALLGAVLLVDPGGLGLNDPLPALTGTAPTPPWQGVVWGSALLADFGAGARSTGVLAVTVGLADPAMAETLRAHVERGWSERVGNLGRTSFAQLTGGPATVSIHPAGAGRWVLRLVQTLPTESFGAGISRNRSFAHLLQGAMQRDLVFLMP